MYCTTPHVQLLFKRREKTSGPIHCSTADPNSCYIQKCRKRRRVSIEQLTKLQGRRGGQGPRCRFTVQLLRARQSFSGRAFVLSVNDSFVTAESWSPTDVYRHGQVEIDAHHEVRRTLDLPNVWRANPTAIKLYDECQIKSKAVAG